MDSEDQPLGSQKEAELKGNNVLVGGAKGGKSWKEQASSMDILPSHRSQSKFFCFGRWAINNDETFPYMNEDPTSTPEWQNP